MDFQEEWIRVPSLLRTGKICNFQFVVLCINALSEKGVAFHPQGAYSFFLVEIQIDIWW